MANTDQIFFASPEPLPQAGHTAAAAMRLQAFPDRVEPDDVNVYGDPAAADLPTEVRGTIWTNIYPNHERDRPELVAIYDDLPYVLDFTIHDEEQLRSECGLLLLRRLVDVLHWRSVLTWTFGVLVASYDDVHGYREFPPGTLSDGTHADRWR